MPHCELDHLVIAASSLDAGVSYLEEMLGVCVPGGGKHPLMGTHNCLMQIGNGAFLELIAIEPDAHKPDHPRWFNLDDPQLQANIAERPRLHTWAIRTDNIADAVAASPISPGQISEGRRGDRVWNITIRADGTLPEHGLLPTLIEWPDFTGPAAGMTDLGCQLEALKITHSTPHQLTEALTAIGADQLVDIGQGDENQPTGLSAVINCPKGKITLS